MPHELIGKILKGIASIPDDRIEEALKVQSEKGGRLGDILIRMGAISDSDVAKAVSIQLGIPYKDDIAPQDIESRMVEKFQASEAKELRFVVLKSEDGVKVATSEPQNLSLMTKIQRVYRKPVKLVVAPQSLIISLINSVYGEMDVSAEEAIVEVGEEYPHDIEETTDILDETGEAPIINFVNRLIFQAVKAKASDIHLEPFEREVSVRLRVDGVLHEVARISKALHEPVVTRVKYMSKLDIAERRKPQDGKIRRKVAGKDIDIRVSTLPTVFGERVALRLLDRSSTFLGLDELGIGYDTLQKFEKLIRKSHGMILATGPTGSGKTTTLYASLDKINSPDVNTITIEDPVEYQLKGINQIQVNPKAGLTFASGLRSILRQDPDIIMVGEIRDAETASIAIHASLTGHLVLSTLHTNDASGAIARLIDMGIEPYLISSSLLAVLAQRLVRKICPSCVEPYEPYEDELAELDIRKEMLPDGVLMRGRGCKECMGTGFKGRTGIFELLVVTDNIRSLINRSADSATIRRSACDEGMLTIKNDGREKVLRGITTLPEVIRVTQEV